MERRQGVRVGCVEEVALRMGFIDGAACYELGRRIGNSGYGQYVMDVAADRVPAPTVEPVAS